jgi:hypothetical protein
MSTASPVTAPTSSYETYLVMPYVDELHQLEATYARAMTHDVGTLAAWLRTQASKPLATFGAGGSLAIAEMAAVLHQRATGRLARSGEPMDLYFLDETTTGTAVLLVTASGGHSDSLFACRLLPDVPTDSAVLCGALDSEGERLLAGTDVEVFAYPMLPKVHGWVAVNSILAQAVVLARAYGEAFPEQIGALPPTLWPLLPDPEGVDASLDLLTATLAEVLAKPALVLLHGPDTRTAQRDLDSKFAESGLGELAASEYRNFAHGRYQALLPRESECGILGIASARESAVAAATFAELPEDLPHRLIAIPGDSAAAEQVACVLNVLFVCGALERVRGTAVGWGSRNTFGDTLYEFDLTPIFRPHGPSATAPLPPR